MVIRPLDLPESELLPLMRAAIAEGVFSRLFLQGLDQTLQDHLRAQDAEALCESGTPFSASDAVRIQMTADEMLALGDAVVALPLLDCRTPDAIIDDLGSP